MALEGGQIGELAGMGSLFHLCIAPCGLRSFVHFSSGKVGQVIDVDRDGDLDGLEIRPPGWRLGQGESFGPQLRTIGQLEASVEQ